VERWRGGLFASDRIKGPGGEFLMPKDDGTIHCASKPVSRNERADVELRILPTVSISTSHFKGQGEALPCPNYYAVAGCSNRRGLSEQRRHTLRGAAAPATRRPSRWPRWVHLVPHHVGREGKEEEGAGDPCRGWRGRGDMGCHRWGQRHHRRERTERERERGHERFFLRYGEERWEIVILFLLFFT